MDFGEVYLIALIYITVLLPQLMSYLVSGIFGCANRLILVEWVTAAATWFVIKFLAVMSGIFMAQAIAALYAAPYLHPADSLRKLLQSMMTISLSFIITGSQEDAVCLAAQTRAEAGERSSLELGRPRNRAERWPGPARSQV